MSLFQPATKLAVKLRLGLVGPSGAGKTYSALRIAHGLGKRIAVIDTEHGSARLYAGDTNPDGGEFAFDVVEIDDHSLDNYIQTIRAAGDHGYDVLVIDSLSHAWVGKGGALEEVDAASARSKGNKFVAWRDVTPKHTALIDAMLASPCHVVATMRAKTEYVQEKDDRGRTNIRKVGLAPIQRDGMEYEFTVVGDIDHDHRLVVTKSRCAALADAVIVKPGRDFTDQLRAWLEDGADPVKDLNKYWRGRLKGMADKGFEMTEDERRRVQARLFGADSMSAVDPKRATKLMHAMQDRTAEQLIEAARKVLAPAETPNENAAK